MSESVTRSPIELSAGQLKKQIIIENQNVSIIFFIQNISKIRRKLISSSSSKSNKISRNIDGLLCLYVYKKYSQHVEYTNFNRRVPMWSTPLGGP